MKKIITILMAMTMILTACSGGNTKVNTEEKTTEEFKIGIVQYIEHPALDAARDGFIKGLEDAGVKANIDVKSAQADIGVARTISEKFVSDGVDLIFAIATPAAEAAVGATSEIPILFSAVTDPVAAHLVESNENPGGNVTGTSDIVDIESQLKLFKEINPDIKKIGIVFSADEINSQTQVEMVEELIPNLGLELEVMSIQNISDLPQVAESLTSKVDGVYMLSDNKIASSVSLLADVLVENKKPLVGAEEAHIEGGGLISNGISYFGIGEQAGVMAKKILVDGINPGEIPVESSHTITKIVNRETLKALGLDENLKAFEGAEFIGE